MTYVKQYSCARCSKPCSRKGGHCAACNALIPARERSREYGAFQLKQSHLVTGKGNSPAYDLTAPTISPETAHRAALTVAEHVPASEVRGVLEMLGLEAA